MWPRIFKRNVSIIAHSPAMRMEQEFLYPKKKRRKRRKRRKRKEKIKKIFLQNYEEFSAFQLIKLSTFQKVFFLFPASFRSVLILSDIHIGLVTMHQRFQFQSQLQKNPSQLGANCFFENPGFRTFWGQWIFKALVRASQVLGLVNWNQYLYIPRDKFAWTTKSVCLQTIPWKQYWLSKFWTCSAIHGFVLNHFHYRNIYSE